MKLISTFQYQLQNINVKVVAVHLVGFCIASIAFLHSNVAAAAGIGTAVLYDDDYHYHYHYQALLLLQLLSVLGVVWVFSLLLRSGYKKLTGQAKKVADIILFMTYWGVLSCIAYICGTYLRQRWYNDLPLSLMLLSGTVSVTAALGMLVFDDRHRVISCFFTFFIVTFYPYRDNNLRWMEFWEAGFLEFFITRFIKWCCYQRSISPLLNPDSRRWPMAAGRSTVSV